MADIIFAYDNWPVDEWLSNDGLVFPYLRTHRAQVEIRASQFVVDENYVGERLRFASLFGRFDNSREFCGAINRFNQYLRLNASDPPLDFESFPCECYTEQLFDDFALYLCDNEGGAVGEDTIFEMVRTVNRVVLAMQSTGEGVTSTANLHRVKQAIQNCKRLCRDNCT